MGKLQGREIAELWAQNVCCFVRNYLPKWLHHFAFLPATMKSVASRSGTNCVSVFSVFAILTLVVSHCLNFHLPDDM